jgi:hypothetical protein
MKDRGSFWSRPQDRRGACFVVFLFRISRFCSAVSDQNRTKSRFRLSSTLQDFAATPAPGSFMTFGPARINGRQYRFWAVISYRNTAPKRRRVDESITTSMDCLHDHSAALPIDPRVGMRLVVVGITVSVPEGEADPRCSIFGSGRFDRNLISRVTPEPATFGKS